MKNCKSATNTSFGKKINMYHKAISQIVSELREQNPQKTDRDVITLLMQHIEASETVGSFHGLLLSGYSSDWKYKGNPDSEDE